MPWLPWIPTYQSGNALGWREDRCSQHPVGKALRRDVFYLLGYCLGFSIPTKAPDALVAMLNLNFACAMVKLIAYERSDFMKYSPAQYELLEKLANGVIYDHLTADEQETLYFLEEEGLAGARVDIEDGLYKLKEPGKTALSIWQENERRKQTEENEKLQQAVREKADREAERKAEHRFQVWLSFWNALIAAVFGALVSNIDRIIPAVAAFVEKMLDQL